jgi:hypothetical protein
MAGVTSSVAFGRGRRRGISHKPAISIATLLHMLRVIGGRARKSRSDRRDQSGLVVAVVGDAVRASTVRGAVTARDSSPPDSVRPS